MIHWIVTGRICFDDEDSLYILKCDTEAEAFEAFRRAIWEDGDKDHPLVPADEVTEDEDIIYVLHMVRVESNAAPTHVRSPQ